MNMIRGIKDNEEEETYINKNESEPIVYDLIDNN